MFKFKNLFLIKLIIILFIPSLGLTSKVEGLKGLNDNFQILPNGQYELTWQVHNAQEDRVDFLANDYVEIKDNKINFLHMPCHRGLDANQRHNFDYKISSDLSLLQIYGEDVGIWNNKYIKNDSGNFELSDITLIFDNESITNSDPENYELSTFSNYIWEDKISLTISRNSNIPKSTFKCLYEKIDFESATVNTANELNNGLSGVKKSNVFGNLYLPENNEKKFPLVITAHPSMGFTQLDYFEWLTDLGVAVFDIQPYLSRGIENQWFYSVSEETATIDAYKALDLMSKDNRIDKDKIILLGWSFGGMVANSAHQQFFIDKINPKNEFQAFVSYYPFCSLVKENTLTSNKPLVILIGDKDRMCPFELCQDYINIVKKSSPDSKIYILEDSYHRFDFNLLPEKLNIGRAEKWTESYVKKVINESKRYNIGEAHADIMGPNGWSYISQLSKNERDIILDPYREDENYIGYNQKTDKEARKILAKIICEL